MDHLNTLFQKWMPFRQCVAVDSTPKLHGIWDTINSTLATSGPPTHLPSEFYDARAREIIDRIVMEEEYVGFKESNEYRTIGIGALLGEVVQRMIRSSAKPKELQTSGRGKEEEKEGGNLANDLFSRNKSTKIALFGRHDSTLAAILNSLGALEGENNTWPSYTSSLAIELFPRGSRLPPARTSSPNLAASHIGTPALRTTPLQRLPGHDSRLPSPRASSLGRRKFLHPCEYKFQERNQVNQHLPKRTLPSTPPSLPTPLTKMHVHRVPSVTSSTSSPQKIGRKPVCRIWTSLLFLRRMSRLGTR